MDLAQQWSYIERIAAERLSHNKTPYHRSEYGEYIEVIGAAGELAARRFLHLPEELHTYLDGGTDMCYRGIRVDVKATLWTRKLQKRYLQWPITKVIKADVVLLTAVKIEEQSAIIVGYALPHDIGRAPINQERDYVCYEIPVPRLRKASRLLFVNCRDDLYPGTQAQARDRYEYHQEGARA